MILTLLVWIIDNWEDVRELSNAWFLTSNAIREIFSLLLSQWKACLKNIDEKDKVMFDYSDIEMQSFMKCWMPIFVFNWNIKDNISKIF